jgi:hypothetical protein
MTRFLRETKSWERYLITPVRGNFSPLRAQHNADTTTCAKNITHTQQI